MKFITLVAAATLSLIAAAQVQAQSVAPVPPGCAKELNGDIFCPPMGGGIFVTMPGQVVCGKGKCVRDIFGKITCSTQPGGQIIQDVTGKITCAGSCEEASNANCQRIQ